MNDQPKAPESSPSPRPSVSAEVRSFAGAVHENISQNIQFADQKAGFLFAAVAAMLAFLYQKGITTAWMKNPASWHPGDYVAFAAVFGLAVGAFFAVAVVLPRTGGDSKGDSEGLVFWKSIAKYKNAEAYANKVREPQSDLTEEMLHHCYELAKNCKLKYLFVHIAGWCGGIGLLASILFLVFF
jgi:hypothetical protein